jgi:hypothetical protein
MALRKKCTEFFAALLADVGCTFDEDGTIRHFERNSKGGVKHPKVKIENLDVVLPYKEQLQKPEGENIIFAPLNENALSGESAVITVLKKLSNTNIQYRLTVALTTIAALLMSKAPIKGKLLNVIKDVPEYNKVTDEKLRKLLSRSGRLPISTNLIGIYLTHKNQKFEGKSVKRLATVVSPLIQALKGDGQVWGLDVGDKHKTTIIALINAVLPDVNDDFYTTGSNNHTAPYFHSLACSFGKVSERLGYIEDLLRPYQTADVLACMPAPVVNEWQEIAADFSDIAKAFPPLCGNNGNVPVGREVRTDLGGVKVDEVKSGTESTGGWDNAPADKPAAKSGGIWDAEPARQAAPTGSWDSPNAGNSGWGNVPQTNQGFNQPAKSVW